MKAALVLNAESPSFQQQAAEINRFLNDLSTTLSRVELWLFYGDHPPEIFPEMVCPISSIKIIRSENDYLPESYLQLLEQLANQHSVDILLFSSDGLGAELATRLAYRLNGSSSVQVESCKHISHNLEITKPLYGNNLTGRFLLKQAPYCISVAKHPCPPVNMIPNNNLKIESITLNQPPCDWTGEVVTIPDSRDMRLAHAELVLVVGQGVKNKKTVDVLQSMAERIGAELGASRPVVMNAWTHMNRLIGASGLIISPKLCIAAGVSGAAVFSVGIKHSEFIVAVNTDSKAPIFRIAHVGIVGDLKTVLAELEKLIMAGKTKKGLHPEHKSGVEK
jgi:electron transfer flavoprotein alpha subunit